MSNQTYIPAKWTILVVMWWANVLKVDDDRVRIALHDATMWLGRLYDEHGILYTVVHFLPVENSEVVHQTYHIVVTWKLTCFACDTMLNIRFASAAWHSIELTVMTGVVVVQDASSCQ